MLTCAVTERDRWMAGVFLQFQQLMTEIARS